MKKSLFTIVMIIGLTFAVSGCKQSVQKKEKTNEDYFNEALAEAEKSPQIEKELFLGFRFGMSKEEVDKHLKSLRKSGKIYINKEGYYQYDFQYDSSMTILIGFIPKYYKDSLYIMTYTLDDKYGIGSTLLEQIRMKQSFGDSERGKNFNSYHIKDVLDEHVWHFIKDNLLVTFRGGISSSYMDYINVPVSVLAKQEEKRKEEELRKQSEAEF